ncbi:MAG TPA: bacterioferritin [Phycisphaerae bacterium]|nr:bacterioferritin [Phycisphaerae bacterium]
MKGNEKVLSELNALLAEELTAINQYMVHAEMDEDWGYGKLHEAVQKRAIDEMKHAEKLIQRLLFLEGTPIVSELKKIQIGADVPKQLANDVKAEYGAIKHYNAVIKLCAEAGDAGTKQLLESIVKDEEAHVDDIESLQSRVEQMGLSMFLSTQAS